MRNQLFLTLTISSLALLSSCSKLGTLSSDNFSVTPAPLEATGGEVPATINGAFPAKYMKKKVVVTVQPELRYANGEVAKGTPYTFQGEGVMGNNTTVPYKSGSRYTMKAAFPYVPEMQQSELWLTFNGKIGSKQQNIPAVKIGNGVIATSQLYRNALAAGGGCIAPDTFQRVKQQKQEASIKFLINQANLRKSELKNNSVKEFVDMLRRINTDRENLNLRNVEIQAYASPEGGYDYNDKLANKRKNTSNDYVEQQLKAAKLQGSNIDAHYTAQDWDGFRQLVQASDIQDKDVILRVLSMYKDPAEREQQIRNMSLGFRQLAEGILPELRRSRLIINYETIGRSDDQIMAQLASDPARLSPDELLYAATLQDNEAAKEAVYVQTTKIFDKDYRAFNNLAAMAFAQGNDSQARQYIEQALALNPNAPEAYANMALLDLKKGDIAQAEAHAAKAVEADDFNKVMGNINIAKGNYAAAAANLKDQETNTAALAQLLNKDYAAAVATLRNVKNPDALTSYLTALVLNRQGNTAGAKDALSKAKAMDARIAAYAAKDLEIANLR